MQLGLVGLGKMGHNMRERMRQAGLTVVVIANLDAQAKQKYRIGMPETGLWKLRFNSDATNYSDAFGDFDSFDVTAYEGECDGLGAHAEIDIAPYSLLIYSMDE